MSRKFSNINIHQKQYNRHHRCLNNEVYAHDIFRKTALPLTYQTNNDVKLNNHLGAREVYITKIHAIIFWKHNIDCMA